MTPLLVWGRRSSAVYIAPIVLVMVALAAWSSSGWQYEWLWGMRNPVSILSLISPLVAAGVAFDTSRRWTPLVRGLGPSARRWRRATLTIPLVHVLWAFAAVCVVWATAALRLSLSDSIGSADAWLPFETIASLTAAAAVGLMAGRYLSDAAAPPVAALGVVATAALSAPFGLTALFSPVGLSSSAVGLTRDGGAAALLIGLNLALAALCCLLALPGARPSLPWLGGVAVAGAVFVAVLAQPPTEYEYRPVAGPTVCADQADVKVCGPQAAEPVLQDLSAALQQAVDNLSGLPFPDTYELGLPGVVPPTDPGRAVANVSPAKLRGSSRTRTVADILALPRICPQLLGVLGVVGGVDETTLLLDRQAQVRAWIEQALRTGQATAPAEIQAAYAELLTCRPTRS